MIYSVFNWNSARFDYFDAPGDKFGNRPKSRLILNQPNSTHGVPIEALAPIVPAGARRAGSGTAAKGRVAVMANQVMSPAGKAGGALAPGLGLGGLGDLEDNPLISSPWLTLGLWFGAFVVGFKVISAIAKR